MFKQSVITNEDLSFNVSAKIIEMMKKVKESQAEVLKEKALDTSNDPLSKKFFKETNIKQVEESLLDRQYCLTQGHIKV